MKQFTRNRARRLTRKEKIIVSNAGLNPEAYLCTGENDLYLFLDSKFLDDHAAVPKAPNAKNAPPGISVTARGA